MSKQFNPRKYQLFKATPKTNENKRLQQLLENLLKDFNSPAMRAWREEDRVKWFREKYDAIVEDHFVRNQEALQADIERMEKHREAYFKEFEADSQQRIDERAQIQLEIDAMTDDEVIESAQRYAGDKEHYRPNWCRAIKARLRTMDQRKANKTAIVNGKQYNSDDGKNSMRDAFDKAMDQKNWQEPWRAYGEGEEIEQSITYHSTPLGHVRHGAGEWEDAYDADEFYFEETDIEELVNIEGEEVTK